MGAETDALQQRVLQFLSRIESYANIIPVSEWQSGAHTEVQVARTHSAIVFLVGEHAFKVKRAIAFSYLDMSTLDARHRLCLREFDVNQQSLPDIYISVLPIVTTEAGALQLGGNGTPVEWVIHMHRFPESHVLDHMASAGLVDNRLAESIGQSIAGYHSQLPEQPCLDGYARIREVVEELVNELSALPRAFTQTSIDHLNQQLYSDLTDCRDLLEKRARSGFVKRCHGDLHLRNLVLYKGIPKPFDALEFDERLATTDVLYDLAFLLMDLGHRRLHQQANRALNQYLLHSDALNLEGLRLLPLFMACRACIRAMTTAQSIATNPADSAALSDEAKAYLDRGLNYLEYRSPLLIAIGGLSGTGKSTLSLQLAPMVGRFPGAVMLRSDAERKIAHGIPETEALPEEHYSTETSRQNYALLLRKAEMALNAGMCVVVDAVFLDAEQRAAIESCAQRCGCRFHGFWLAADSSVLEQRIQSRVNDASDATVAVLARQQAMYDGQVKWPVIDTAVTRDEVLTSVYRYLRFS